MFLEKRQLIRSDCAAKFLRVNQSYVVGVVVLQLLILVGNQSRAVLNEIVEILSLSRVWLFRENF